MILRYQLKNKRARTLIDLQEFAAPIIRSVRSVFRGSYVTVYEDYFEIEADEEELSSQAMLQNMGRRISYNCETLRQCVMTYGDSRQLFVRIPQGGRRRD